MLRLPRMHRDQQPLPVPHPVRPPARHQALGRRHRHHPQLHHRPVLGPVRELLGHREPGPGTAVGMEGMPVDHPLLPLPVPSRPLLRVSARRLPPCPARDSANEATLCAEFGGEGRAVRYGRGRSSAGPGRRTDVRSSRTAVAYAAVAYGSACGPCSRRPSARRRVRPVPAGLPSGDPGQRLMGERTPQPGQHRRPGPGQLGGVPRRESGADVGQFVGDLGLGAGGTVHGRAPRVRVGRRAQAPTTDILIVSV